MSPQHALELLLHPDDEESVRQQWQALEEAGVRSLARHRGSTHRPHLTVVTGGPPDEAVLDLARTLLGPLLPLTATVEGPVLLGGRRPTLARRLGVPEAARSARGRLTARWPGADRRPWVPHVSLTRRTHPSHLVPALTALGPTAGSVRLVQLRWWDPDAGTVTHL
ncbi:MAG TPA: 2'-5' RNA ligase family protein [Ornithinimicrobium sp.]|nr:2'-5' RNA ligase family protein [Ornithinimicrobium sp.]